MSDDEVFVTLVSAIVGPLGWMWWLFRASSIDGVRPGRRTAILSTGIGLVGLLILVALGRYAADDVRDAPQYLLMYFLLGLAWLRLAAAAFPLAGLNPRDDLIERRNAAAMPAWIGAMVGVAFCYIGGNIGNGPGWWVVVFSAGLATAAFGGVWLAIGQASGLVELVTVGRDVAAGIRLGGLLAACGLIFGAAVAGDWLSTPATVIDFVARGWPALPIVLIAILTERVMQPTPDRLRAPVVQAGVVPAVLYLVLAALALTLPSWVPQ